MATDETMRGDIDWHEVDKPITALKTDVKYITQVRREAIPIIFVPGIMGSTLRRKGTDGRGKGEKGLPNLRWNGNTFAFFSKSIFSNYIGASPASRKEMLIGDLFSPNYLEVHEERPSGDGFQGILESYHEFLNMLRDRDWGAINKVFSFPVFAFGYNWTDSARASGKLLQERIDHIIQLSHKQVGLCEKVILVTHSMGGLVARAACHLHGAEGNVLGVIHGVMPAFGAPVAYWRMKGGIEAPGLKDLPTSGTLGPSGRHVTAVLANSIGGLQLLPNKLYRTKDGDGAWLRFKGDGAHPPPLPGGGTNPYTDIYRIPAQPRFPSAVGGKREEYWGLVDPNLLSPEIVIQGGDALDHRAAQCRSGSIYWGKYIECLAEAESFHDDLKAYLHPTTWMFHGNGLETADWVEIHQKRYFLKNPANIPVENDPSAYEHALALEISSPYNSRSFVGYFRDNQGKIYESVLQDPAGDGDGTVPVSSATMLGANPKPVSPGPPSNHAFPGLKHQPAYESKEVQRWVVAAITALAKKRFEQMRKA